MKMIPLFVGLTGLFMATPSLATTMIEIASAGGLTFSREVPTGYLAISDGEVRLPLGIDERLNFYLQGAFEFEGHAYMLVYNTATNVPSGRRLSRGPEGNDLYRVDWADGVLSLEMVATIPAGIDIRMETSAADGGLLICATTACVRAASDWFGRISFNPVPVPPSHEIVEVSGTYQLLQAVYDDQFDQPPAANSSIFLVCQLPSEIEACEQVPANVIPYDLKKDGSYTSAVDWEALLRFDYDRIGIADYAQSNLEARIAWSSVYYLSGFAALYEMPISDEFRARVKERLTKEIEALADLTASSYPGLASRRYSLDREPITFLLHVARIVKAIKASEPVVGASLTNRALAPILNELRSPQRTVEVLATAPRDELQYRVGMPFWADGSNVPWNYQSGWIEAVALTGTPPELRTPIARMLTTFSDEENLAQHPDKWSYAGGTFNAGWETGLSSNTPTYKGQAAINIMAHISYRSMDALAVLAAARDGIEPISGFEDYAADLVSRGYLYPFVNEGLATPAPIPFHIARHYARSWLPWQFQNQVWAFKALQNS